VKTVHARAPGSGKTEKARDLYPFEAMSFPVIDLQELVGQDWDAGTADFPEEIQRLLVIPTYSGSGSSKQPERRIGRAFFWSPTAAQMYVVEADWREIHEVVASGKAAERPVFNADGTRRMRKTAKRMLPVNQQDLPGERKGHILHMRPHAADADVKVPVPGGEVTAQCFWLNKDFIHTLLLASRSADLAAEAGITVA
jgi:DNA mismatch repair protein MutH